MPVCATLASFSRESTGSVASRNRWMIRLSEWIPHGNAALLLCGQTGFAPAAPELPTLLIQAAHLPPAGIINQLFSCGAEELLYARPEPGGVSRTNGSEVDASLSKQISPDVSAGSRSSGGFYPEIYTSCFLLLPQNLTDHSWLRKEIILSKSFQLF